MKFIQKVTEIKLWDSKQTFSLPAIGPTMVDVSVKTNPR